MPACEYLQQGWSEWIGRWCELVFLASRKREAIEPGRVTEDGTDCPERWPKNEWINNTDYRAM
jgi:hypothetical protein